MRSNITNIQRQRRETQYNVTVELNWTKIFTKTIQIQERLNTDTTQISSKLNFKNASSLDLVLIFYLLCFLAFLGPFTKAHSTAMV